VKERGIARGEVAIRSKYDACMGEDENRKEAMGGVIPT
jgi:hypothetical protein